MKIFFSVGAHGFPACRLAGNRGQHALKIIKAKRLSSFEITFVEVVGAHGFPACRQAGNRGQHALKDHKNNKGYHIS